MQMRKPSSSHWQWDLDNLLTQWRPWRCIHKNNSQNRPKKRTNFKRTCFDGQSGRSYCVLLQFGL